MKLHLCWLRWLLSPSLGLAPAGLLQAAFKSTPGRFVTRITYLSKLIGMRSLAAAMQLQLFWVYNDNFGHIAGDAALVKVASALIGNKKEQDKIARFGGEEFIILLPETSAEGCIAACERLRDKIGNITNLCSQITISIGAVTLYPEHDQNITLNDLLGNADKNLYEAKHHGRNNVKHSLAGG